MIEEKVNISLFDTQAFGTLPEPVNRLVPLVTKAAMGVLLAYFSANELMLEIKDYRSQLALKRDVDGRL